MKHQNTAYYNFFCWTEDNRLQAVKDEKNGSYYNYDASGERNLKLTGGSMDVIQNGYPINIPIFDQQTLYASALVTINDKGYTKHYFEEGKRICSKIGSGKLRNINTLVDEFWDGYDKQQIYTEEGVTNTYKQCMGITPKIKTQDIYTNIIKKYEDQVNADEPVFYYHGDHLGSASYITEDNGNPTQQIVYLPFGEDWVDIKYNTSQFETPYKFNGKEKDEETSYNYYGARYYYDHLSIFLSVDPMSDKYPHLSPYAYCANNPIMLIDPNGEDVIIAGEDGSKYNYGKDKKYEGHDKFIKASIETLDKMNSTDEGKKVLSDLIGSEGIYNITNGKDEEGTGSFVGNKNEKGGTLNMNGNLSLNSLSHELFHSYQHEHVQGGASIFNELEAYSFAFDVTLDYDISTNFMSNTHSGAGTYKLAIDPKTSSGKAYEDSFDKSNYMDTAVKLFQSQSTANNSGLYNKYPLRKNNQKNNLYNLKK